MKPLKPATPRKSRRRNQPTSGSAHPPAPANPLPASDYESDAPQQQQQQQQQQQHFTLQQDLQSTSGGRTIGDMNLAVLKRHLPTVHSYISMSHNTTVYEWDADNDSWGDATFKGPLFLCDLHPDVDADVDADVDSPTPTSQPRPRQRTCIFVINRLSLDNLVLDLAHVSVCQQNDDVRQLIELSATVPSGAAVNWGLFIDQESLEGTWAAIQDRWHAVRKTAQ